METQTVKVNFLLGIKSIALDVPAFVNIAIPQNEAYTFEIGFTKSKEEGEEYLRKHNAQKIENAKENFGIIELHRLPEGK